jgi:hypothetical protein
MQDSVVLALASMWIGFAVAHQVSAQTAIDAKHPLGGTWRFWVGRIIFALVGVSGALGLAALIGSRPDIKQPAFAVGFVSGLLLFVLARKLLAEQR